MLYAGLEPEHEDRLDAQDTGPSHLFLRPSYLIIYWFHLLGGCEAEKLRPARLLPIATAYVRGVFAASLAAADYISPRYR